MTDRELYDYFWKILLNGDATKEQKTAMSNARNFWHEISDKVYEKYGDRLINPTHICDTINPFTIHLTWDYRDGNILGCSISEKLEIYVCFNNDSHYWSEYLTLPNILVSERLMNTLYDYYREQH